MHMLLENLTIDNIEYTYVDSFTFNDIMVNCYRGDNDYLFSFNKEDREEIINKVFEFINSEIEQICELDVKPIVA